MKSIRGGICQSVKRYAVSKPNRPIMYIDANNLYGWAMSQPLPTGDFKMRNQFESDSDEIKFLMSITADNPIGYTYEVDLYIPENLHDYLSDLPPAPEKMFIPSDKLSPYQKRKLNNKPRPKVDKLILTLSDKKNYVIHYRLLQLYIKLGVKITQFHRVISYKQSKWMEPYISSNTEARKKSKSSFEKSFWKLLNNSVYGKTIEDVLKRVNMKILFDPDEFRNAIESQT